MKPSWGNVSLANRAGWGRGAVVLAGAALANHCALFGGFDLSGYSQASDGAAVADASAAARGVVDASPAPAVDATAGRSPLVDAAPTGAPDASSGGKNADSAVARDATGGGTLDAATSSADAAPADAGVVIVADVSGGMAAEAGPVLPDANDPGIYCEGTYCNPANAICCSAIGTTDMDTCFPLSQGGGQCPSSEVLVACDDAYDCAAAGQPATVCCGVHGLDGTSQDIILESSCIDLGSCASNYTVVFCDRTAPSPCQGGATCVSFDGGPLSRCVGP